MTSACAVAAVSFAACPASPGAVDGAAPWTTRVFPWGGATVKIVTVILPISPPELFELAQRLNASPQVG
ncbi:MAG TPA: hypothetical protein VGI66_00295 [Streptosporangiaceae bacterium]